MRTEFSAKVRVEAFKRCGGNCEECNNGKKLLPHDIFYDHIIPDAMGGEASLENCQVLCRSHHDTKTFTQDVPAIAKAKRIERRHIGIKKPSSFACSKNSKWKKKVGGEVVARN